MLTGWVAEVDVCAKAIVPANANDVAASMLVLMDCPNGVRSSCELGMPTKYESEQSELAIVLSDMVGRSYGSQRHPDVCCGRSGGQPLSGGNPPGNSAPHIESLETGPQQRN